MNPNQNSLQLSQMSESVEPPSVGLRNILVLTVADPGFPREG